MQLRSHDWIECPFGHPNEKATRRPPSTYAATMCPDIKEGCPRGKQCHMAHSVFEYWLHPMRYRTSFCKDGNDCKRKLADPTAGLPAGLGDVGLLPSWGIPAVSDLQLAGVVASLPLPWQQQHPGGFELKESQAGTAAASAGLQFPAWWQQEEPHNRSLYLETCEVQPALTPSAAGLDSNLVRGGTAASPTKVPAHLLMAASDGIQDLMGADMRLLIRHQQPLPGTAGMPVQQQQVMLCSEVALLPAEAVDLLSQLSSKATPYHLPASLACSLQPGLHLLAPQLHGSATSGFDVAACVPRQD
eukprot:gene11913-12057_t